MTCPSSEAEASWAMPEPSPRPPDSPPCISRPAPLGPRVQRTACSRSPPWARVPTTSAGWGGVTVLREPGPPGPLWEVWTHTPSKQTSQTSSKATPKCHHLADSRAVGMARVAFLAKCPFCPLCLLKSLPSDSVARKCNQGGRWDWECDANGDPSRRERPVAFLRGTPQTRLRTLVAGVSGSTILNCSKSHLWISSWFLAVHKFGPRPGTPQPPPGCRREAGRVPHPRHREGYMEPRAGSGQEPTAERLLEMSRRKLHREPDLIADAASRLHIHATIFPHIYLFLINAV